MPLEKDDKDRKVLRALLKDPTMSLRDIAKNMKSYRQKVWRTKTKLENEKVIWGYTAVVDEIRMDHVMYVIMMKMKPMSKELVEILMRRINVLMRDDQEVRLIEVLYVNGEFDWMIKFSAPNHTIARRYYDSIRVDYDEHLLEKPLIIDVNFTMVNSGKVNPDIERLYDFIPEATK